MPDEQPSRTAHRTVPVAAVGLGFLLSTVASLGVVAAYWMDAARQVMGALIAAAFGMLGASVLAWARLAGRSRTSSRGRSGRARRPWRVRRAFLPIGPRANERPCPAAGSSGTASWQRWPRPGPPWWLPSARSARAPDVLS